MNIVFIYLFYFLFFYFTFAKIVHDFKFVSLFYLFIFFFYFAFVWSTLNCHVYEMCYTNKYALPLPLKRNVLPSSGHWTAFGIIFLDGPLIWKRTTGHWAGSTPWGIRTPVSPDGTWHYSHIASILLGAGKMNLLADYPSRLPELAVPGEEGGDVTVWPLFVSV